MLISAMGAMMESMSAPSVHHLSPPRPSRAKGLARSVYRQMRRDFMVASPFVLHGPVPELLAAAWVVVRESLFTGEAARGDKEIVAWAVSEANQCPFCVGAHHAAVRAAGARDAALESWAVATGWAQSPELAAPQFGAHHAEYYATSVAFHYLNRMVSVFLDDKMMPVPDFMDRVTDWMATLMMGGMIRRGRRNDPGASLELLPEYDAALAWQPRWAEDHPSIAAALAGWSGVIETTARQHLSAEILDRVGAVIDAWDGSAPDMTEEWPASRRPELGPALQPAADLALRAAITPYLVDDASVKALVEALGEERVLVLVSWAAQRAARGPGNWIDAAAPAPALVS